MLSSILVDGLPHEVLGIEPDARVVAGISVPRPADCEFTSNRICPNHLACEHSSAQILPGKTPKWVLKEMRDRLSQSYADVAFQSFDCTLDGLPAICHHSNRLGSDVRTGTMVFRRHNESTVADGPKRCKDEEI